MKKGIIVLLVLAAFAVMGCNAPQYFKDGEYTSPDMTIERSSETAVDGTVDETSKTNETAYAKDMSATLDKGSDTNPLTMTWTYVETDVEGTGDAKTTTTTTYKATLKGEWIAIETFLVLKGELTTVVTEEKVTSTKTTTTVTTNVENNSSVEALITSSKSFEFEGITFTLK